MRRWHASAGLVGAAGLEPARPFKPLDFKSNVSTCSTTLPPIPGPPRLFIPPQGRLEQLPELLDAEPRVGHDPAHGIGVYGIVARDGEIAVPVGHHHVLATFTNDPKAGPLEGANGAAMVDARNLGHRYSATSTSRTFSPTSVAVTAA